MNCPQCNDVSMVMSERQGVEIDYCPRCRGVWLDRGELDKIVERSDSYDRRDDKDDDDDDRRKSDRSSREYEQRPQKKKSFWHELFD